MIFIKFTICLGIVTVSGYIGFLKAKTYELRVETLRKIQGALNMFKSKIEYTYEPIADIFNEISKVIYENKNNIFLNSAKLLKTNGITESWYSAVNSEIYLKNEDKETLKTMGKLLGKTEKNGQISEINFTQNLIENQIEKAELEKNKNVKLYRTLGIVLGIGLVILVI